MGLSRWLTGVGAALKRPRPSADGWDKADAYHTLHRRLAVEGPPADPAAFAAGPLRRFLELACEDGLSPGERVRILEHARHWVAETERRLAGRPEREAELRRTIDRELDALVQTRGDLGVWVGEVLRGPYTHHAPPPAP